MTDPSSPPSGLERIFLLPGEYHITKKPKFLATLLGSCVAVCIKNHVNGSAAMNHFVRARPDTPAEKNAGKFGTLSTHYIIDTLLSLDPSIAHYKAKIFGGGKVVGHLDAGFRIGQDNIEVARNVLKEYGIPLVDEDTGGNRGRKIYYDTSDFKISVRPIGPEKKDFSEKNIRVLVVDDSSLVRNILSKVIESEPGMEVCGKAKDAFEARDLILSTDPDVISLDIIMPRLGGLEFLEKIMKYCPKPVIIVSTIAKTGSSICKKAYDLGAVGVVDKDSLEIYKSIETAKRQLVPMIRTASSRVVRP